MDVERSRSAYVRYYPCILLQRLTKNMEHVLGEPIFEPGTFRIKVTTVSAWANVLSYLNFSVYAPYLLLYGRSQRPHGLRRRSAAERLLGSWVRVPPGAWIFVSCTVFVLSGRGLCDGPIPRPEESYRLWCVSECDQVKIKKPILACCQQVGRRRRNNETIYKSLAVQKPC
jgi:hypothetical protein